MRLETPRFSVYEKQLDCEVVRCMDFSQHVNHLLLKQSIAGYR